MNENLAEYEYIFISFGEIDCRADEGILPYCHKYGKSIEEITQKTVKNSMHGPSSYYLNTKINLFISGCLLHQVTWIKTRNFQKKTSIGSI